MEENIFYGILALAFGSLMFIVLFSAGNMLRQDNFMTDNFGITEVCNFPEQTYNFCIAKDFPSVDEESMCQKYISEKRLVCNNFKVEVIDG